MSKSPARTIEVHADQAGRRLDNFLGSLIENAPKSFIYRIIRRGEVRINGGRAKPDTRLAAHDKVRIPPLGENVAQAPLIGGEKLSRVANAIIYEDDTTLVLNKPSGLAVHAGTHLRYGVIDIARRLRPDCPSLELVHRLDRDTSGCLLLAKTYPRLTALQRHLSDPASAKHYLALLKGQWRGGARDVDLALATHQYGGEKRTRVSPEGKSALTRFTPRERFGDATLTDVVITTGRTHQIRVHAAALEHPVIGDPKYGDETANADYAELGLKRLFLHAASITIPVGDSLTTIEAPLPTELQAVLEQLRE